MAVMCPVPLLPPSNRQQQRNRGHIVAVLATFAAKRPLGCPRWHADWFPIWRLRRVLPYSMAKTGCATYAPTGVKTP